MCGVKIFIQRTIAENMNGRSRQPGKIGVISPTLEKRKQKFRRIKLIHLLPSNVQMEIPSDCRCAPSTAVTVGLFKQKLVLCSRPGDRCFRNAELGHGTKPAE